MIRQKLSSSYKIGQQAELPRIYKIRKKYQKLAMSYAMPWGTNGVWKQNMMSYGTMWFRKWNIMIIKM